MDNSPFYTLLIWLIPLPPLLAFGIILLFLKRSNRTSHLAAILATSLSFVASMVVFVKALGTSGLVQNPLGGRVDWMPTGEGWLQIGVMVDPLTAVMLFFVAWTILMIFVYSVGYHNFGQPAGDHDRPGLPPHGAEVKGQGKPFRVFSIEPMYARFFALISLFAFAMYLLVLSDNLLTLYIGWEIMGLCSYLLIGFWYGKESARKAGIKAFITTRIGDVFMLLGLAALYTQTGSLGFLETIGSLAVLDYLATSISPVFGLSWAALIGFLLFFGTVGKSAQFPLHVWLPDAMEGPTPVSAMIHAATMVSAGVYLVIRFFPLISAGWHSGDPLTPVMWVMAVVGAFTALFTATIALAQNDIKRVLAYSTISQLGYMVAALGIGAYTAAAFHLVTHAFFKALLFLGSGSVIHGMEHGLLHSAENLDPQDMRMMGGLKDKMPRTFWTFLAGGMALSGFPLITAGFWSKDEILTGAFGTGHWFVFGFLALAALLTAFYTARQISLVFLGQPRSEAARHAHETKPVMTIPLIILAVFAVGLGWVGIPHEFPLLGSLSPAWFQTFVGSMVQTQAHAEGHSLVPLFTSLVVSLGGLALGWLVYRRFRAAHQKDPLQTMLGFLFRVFQNKYWVDEAYEVLFIRPAGWIAEKISYQLIDQMLIDGLLHALARFGEWIGKQLRFGFDLPVVNGAGDGLAGGARGLGTLMRRMQNGKIQHYMGLAVLFIVLIALLVIIFVVA